MHLLERAWGLIAQRLLIITGQVQLFEITDTEEAAAKTLYLI